jgi:hypothetical protein
MEDPDDRLRISEVDEHPWMVTCGEKGIGETYEWIVIQGESLTKVGCT